MKGLILLVQEDDGVKVSAIEGLSVLEVFNMLQAASQHFAMEIGNLLVEQTKEDATAAEEHPPSADGGGEDGQGEGPKAAEVEP